MRTRMVAMVAGGADGGRGGQRSVRLDQPGIARARPTPRRSRRRALAEKARGDAEKLVGFLIEDFYAELEPTGRLETMGKLAHMAVSYYDGLPAELMTPQTQSLPWHGADPRRRRAAVARRLCRRPIRSSTRPTRIFDELRSAGDDERGRRAGPGARQVHAVLSRAA